MTAVLEALAQELRLADWQLVAASPPGFHPVRAARIVVDGTEVGAVGEVDADVVDALALAGPVVACELDVDALLASRAGAAQRRGRCRAIPASAIDLAFVVADDVPAGAVLRTLREAGGELLESVRAVRRVPLRRARRGEGEPRVRAAVPRARPHADRRRGRRAPPAVHRRGRRRRSRAELRG